MPKEIQELAVILTIAAVIGGLAKLIRMPMIFAYLLAGVVLTASGLVPETTSGLYSLFGNLGIMFLLFLIGLEINYSSLRLVGRISVIIGLVQVAICFVFGTLIGLLLGYSSMNACFIGIMISFSSTVVVVKLLSEKHELNSLHGKIILGVLLVQDFLAMFILVAMAGFESGQTGNWLVVMTTIFKAIAIFFLMLWLGRSLAPKIMHQLAHSPELLFLTTIAWMFVVAAACVWLGLSVEIGGFLAGLALANSSEQFHISNRLRPLRDFFLVLLFITLGSSLSLANLSSLFWPVAVITIAVVIINPVIVSALLSIFGYHRRTAVLSGLHISQLSEFSLVVAAIGFRLGYLSSQLVSVITIAAILTIGISSFLMTHSELIYKYIRQWFHWRENVGRSEARQPKIDVLIIGAHRLGLNIMRALNSKKIMVVDYDPDVIAHLRRSGYDVTYGDIGDEDVIASIIDIHPKVIISTSPDVQDNIGVLQMIRNVQTKRPFIIVRAETEREAKYLYQHGADFVLLPHLMSGLSLGRALRLNDMGELKRWRKNDLKYLSHPA